LLDKMMVCVVLALAAAACGGEEIEGTWEADEKIAGKRHEFTVDSELVGDGKFYLVDGQQVFKCSADVEAKATSREGKFDIEVQFKGDCSNVADVELECELEKDGDVLDCDGLEFNRVEDDGV
jgi:hypothetical protein